MFSSCDLTSDKKAQVSFKPRQALSERSPRAQVTAQFHSSTRSRNWAQTRDDFNSAFMTGMPPEPLAAAQSPPAADSPPVQPTNVSGEKTSGFSPTSFPSFSKLTPLAARDFLPCLCLLIIMRCAWFRG